ncbi:MAG: hypothetical protein MJK07_23255 [Flavobacteriales bacterium]|nr:hypothetical protein [Flavobacteriales bacterium]
MKNKILSLAIFFSVSQAYSQTSNPDTVSHKQYLSTSLWTIANLFPEPADFYQLEYGYRINTKNTLILRAVTWKFNEPIGIPFGPSFESAEEEYPGYVRSFGIGIGYKRYLWKRLSTAVHATPISQNYYDLNNVKLQSGFQLYLQLQTGYQFSLFNGRCFLEPSLAFNYWPVNTNMPESFNEVESRWPNYFIFEPHLNFGVNF